MKLHLHTEVLRLREPFRIAGRAWDACEVLVVELTEGPFVGHGEAMGVYYLNESPASMGAQITALGAAAERLQEPADVQALLPPGGARNALDCALWDLQAKREGRSVWARLNLAARALAIPDTIGVGEAPEAMAADARRSPSALLKIKLDHRDPVARIAAIRAARPDAELIVDANQGWDFPLLAAVEPQLAGLGVTMIEQPLPRGADEALEGYESGIPLCADESCLHLDEMEQASRRYDWINIKLDKAGGLSEALAMAAACPELGLHAMLGCMIGSSLALAPAVVAAHACDHQDLDTAKLLRFDRPHALIYGAGSVRPPSPALWG